MGVFGSEYGYPSTTQVRMSVWLIVKSRVTVAGVLGGMLSSKGESDRSLSVELFTFADPFVSIQTEESRSSRMFMGPILLEVLAYTIRTDFTVEWARN